MNKTKNPKREVSWSILTFDNLKGIENKDDIEEKMKNMTEESLKTQNNQDNDDYVWENM